MALSLLSHNSGKPAAFSLVLPLFRRANRPAFSSHVKEPGRAEMLPVPLQLAAVAWQIESRCLMRWWTKCQARNAVQSGVISSCSPAPWPC